jgi:hypothetical protein
MGKDRLVSALKHDIVLIIADAIWAICQPTGGKIDFLASAVCRSFNYTVESTKNHPRGGQGQNLPMILGSSL